MNYLFDVIILKYQIIIIVNTVFFDILIEEYDLKKILFTIISLTVSIFVAVDWHLRESFVCLVI